MQRRMPGPPFISTQETEKNATRIFWCRNFSRHRKPLSCRARPCQSGHLRHFHGRLWSAASCVSPSAAFSSVSAHSAALIDKLPTFLASTAPNSPRSRVLGGVFGNPPDPSFWDQNSPIAMARTANLAGLKIYFHCGDEDDFGFDSGATALDKVLTSRHVPHEFHIYPGRHDATYFAAHLPASLVFHSRLFPK